MTIESQRTLDFVVIGAQKAGTTTLFEHLREHFDLYLPPSKEASFFNRPELVCGDARRIFDLFFPNAPEGRRLGTVTPEYMCHPGVAASMSAAFPGVRLVALLRDPIERSYSHFRMEVRRGLESRTFEEAISEQLRFPPEERARRLRSPVDTYVSWGEYGRVLGEYMEWFPRQQLLVELTSTLEFEPEAVVRRTEEFIGVSYAAPSQLGKRFHVGSSEQRLPSLQSRLESSRLAVRLWRSLPQRHRDHVFFRFDQWNVKQTASKQSEEMPLSLETRSRLQDHFQDDGEKLAALLGMPLPWLGSRAAPGPKRVND